MNIFQQIKVAWKIRKEINKLMDETKKPGWKTSEFWLAVVGGLVTIGSAAAPLIPAAAFPYIAGVSVVLPSLYMLARTVAKLTSSPKDDAFLEALAARLAPVVKVDAVAPKEVK
jgi:hypothetical protein